MKKSAVSGYAWESATPPGTALMMFDRDKMDAAASSRNSTLAGALTRAQRETLNRDKLTRLLDLISLFYNVPRAKYLLLGPTSCRFQDDELLKDTSVAFSCSNWRNKNSHQEFKEDTENSKIQCRTRMLEQYAELEEK